MMELPYYIMLNLYFRISLAFLWHPTSILDPGQTRPQYRTDPIMGAGPRILTQFAIGAHAKPIIGLKRLN